MGHSYVKGLSVYHSNARLIGLNRCNRLRILDNVGYNIAGNNIFTETGIERYLKIRRNLIVSAISS